MRNVVKFFLSVTLLAIMAFIGFENVFWRWLCCNEFDDQQASSMRKSTSTSTSSKNSFNSLTLMYNDMPSMQSYDRVPLFITIVNVRFEMGKNIYNSVSEVFFFFFC